MGRPRKAKGAFLKSAPCYTTGRRAKKFCQDYLVDEYRWQNLRERPGVAVEPAVTERCAFCSFSVSATLEKARQASRSTSAPGLRPKRPCGVAAGSRSGRGRVSRRSVRADEQRQRAAQKRLFGVVSDVHAAYGFVDLVPMRRDLLQGAGRGQCSFLQPRVHLLDVLEPRLKIANSLTKGAYLLRDRFEVVQAQKDGLWSGDRQPWTARASERRKNGIGEKRH
jgi:hypothetical protein